MSKKVPANYPMHKFIATGGKPKSKQTTKGTVKK